MARTFPGVIPLFSCGLHLAAAAQTQPPSCWPVLLQSPNTAAFFFAIVSPLVHLSLSLSVCPLPTSSTYHPDPATPSTPPPPSLQPCAPSPTSPDGFPLSGKQAYKAFAAVPRSLAVLEPPQVGRWRLGWLTTTTACCDDSQPPRPFHAGLGGGAL